MATRRRKRASGDRPVDCISEVARVGPTYARGLHHLAAPGLGIRQGEPYGRVRLDFELSCGTATVRADGRDFGISLRTCHVGLERENCEVELRSRYEHSLVKGSFEASGTEIQSSERLTDLGIGLEAGLHATAAPATAFGSLVGKLSWGRKKKEQRQETARRQQRVDLVSTFGHDRWRVGDPRHGDARRGDGKLAGTYFVEERDADGEPLPLCVVTRSDPGSPVLVGISVSAPIGQVHIERDGAPANADDRRGVEASLRHKSARARRAHADAQAALRGRIAGLTLGKALAEAQREVGLPVPDGEFLIAQATLHLSASALSPVADDDA